MKNLTGIILLLAYTLPLKSQNTPLEPRIFNGEKYYTIGGQWHVFDDASRQFFTLSDEMLSVKLAPGYTLNQLTNLESNYQIEFLQIMGTDWVNVKLLDTTNVLDKAQELVNTSLIEDIGFGSQATALKIANDSLLAQSTQYPNGIQWGIRVAHVDDAWDYTTGDTSVIIAVVDHGINWGPPDFTQGTRTTPTYWTNSGEDAWSDPLVPGGNGIDDDQNGYIDDWLGWNFAENTQIISDSWSYPHGTGVACVALASTHNIEGMAGVAGGWANATGARGMSVKIVDSAGNNQNSALYAAQAIEYAAQNGAQIINISMAFHTNKTAISAAIELAVYKYNCIVVVGSGNQSGTGNPVFFPANHPLTLAVAISNEQDRTFNSHTGPKLDLGAPGLTPIINVEPLGLPGPKYIMGGGTSLAAPFVSGIAALMLSANPCMNSYDVADILRHRADKVNAFHLINNPNGYDYNHEISKPGHSLTMGYGRVNAKRAVQAALAYQSDSLDLYIKDHYGDFGFPNSYPDTSRFDDWSDIWVRNQSDGYINQEMDTVSYLPGQTNYVYVRVRNKSCASSSAQDSIGLYWSRLSLVNSWPQNWDGTNPQLGNVIDRQALPVLLPGEDTILEIPWNMQGDTLSQWGVCLMARINASDDPISPYPGQLNEEIRNNNNIAARNLYVIRGTGKRNHITYNGERYTHGVNFYAGNLGDNNSPIDIHFDVPYAYGQRAFSEDAEIKLHLGDQIWEAFLELDEEAIQGLEVWDKKVLVVTEPHARLKGLQLAPGQREAIFWGFNYWADAIDSTRHYRYHLTQWQNEAITGSVNFTIERSLREPFSAYAGQDQSIPIGSSAVLTAAPIGESAEYSWYDQGGNQVGEGLSITVSPEETTTYTLQVQAEVDLYKDYDNVKVTVLPYALQSLSPNPAQNSCTVGYEATGASNAYLMLTNASNGTTVLTHTLNPQQNQSQLNLSAVSAGAYLVVLVCDGQIVSSMNLQVQ